MKTIKQQTLRTITYLSIAILAVNYSCADSTKKNDTVNSKTEKTSTVSAPETDIQTAVLTNNIEAVKQHIAAGSDLNVKEPMTGSTPLITAASFGKNEIAALLIEAGADMTRTNNDGATALHTAAFFCRKDVVKTLLAANADKTAKNNFGATPGETIAVPFEQMKPIYEMFKQQLAPMGLDLDIAYIEKTRPEIAQLLQ